MSRLPKIFDSLVGHFACINASEPAKHWISKHLPFCAYSRLHIGPQDDLTLPCYGVWAYTAYRHILN
jgi:hypothetical protein